MRDTELQLLVFYEYKEITHPVTFVQEVLKLWEQDALVKFRIRGLFLWDFVREGADLDGSIIASSQSPPRSKRPAAIPRFAPLLLWGSSFAVQKISDLQINAPGFERWAKDVFAGKRPDRPWRIGKSL